MEGFRTRRVVLLWALHYLHSSVPWVRGSQRGLMGYRGVPLSVELNMHH